MTKDEKQKIGGFIGMIAKSLKATFWTGIVVITIVIILAFSDVPALGLISFLKFLFSLVALINFWVVVSQLNKIRKVMIDSD
jgi:hypothetical protein